MMKKWWRRSVWPPVLISETSVLIATSKKQWNIGRGTMTTGCIHGIVSAGSTGRP